MGAFSKAKGGDFERRTCRKLSLWCSKFKRKDLFWRSAMSGGRATIGLAKGEKFANQSGDITSIDQLGHSLISMFSVECKFYKRMSLDVLFYDTDGLVKPIWKKHVSKSHKLGKLPMIIIKENYRDELVLLCSFGYELLRMGVESEDHFLVKVFVPELDMNAIPLSAMLADVDFCKVRTQFDGGKLNEFFVHCRPALIRQPLRRVPLVAH
jgi:hypothetical protein